MSQEPPSALRKRLELREFVDQNRNLLTAIGVFGGLAALFTRLENAPYLSFLSLAMLIVLGFELWTKSPRTSDSTFTLYVFVSLLLSLILFVAIYLFQFYFVSMVTFFFQILTIAAAFFWVTMARIIGTFLQRHKTMRGAVRISIYVGFILGAFFLGATIAAIIDIISAHA